MTKQLLQLQIAQAKREFDEARTSTRVMETSKHLKELEMQLKSFEFHGNTTTRIFETSYDLEEERKETEWDAHYSLGKIRVRIEDAIIAKDWTTYKIEATTYNQLAEFACYDVKYRTP